MKASKKLLSLFLAIVMIITSCSVGFTAFAADLNPTDSNNEYWSDGTDATAAFSSLNDLANAYIPKLLGIEAVKKLLEEKLGMKVTENTTISDVVVGASPLLLGALGSSVDKNAVIGDATSDNIIPNLNYSYLEDKDAVMNFYALYQFCKDNQSASGKLGEYCKTTLAKLDALLNAYTAANEKANNDLAEALVYVAGDGDKDYGLLGKVMMALGEQGLDMTPENINNCVIDGVAVKDITDPKLQYFLDYVGMVTKGAPGYTMNGLGEAIFIMQGESPYAENFALAQTKALLAAYDKSGTYSDEDLMNAFNGDASSPAYSDMVMACIILSGIYTEKDVKDNYIDDKQLAKMVEDLTGKDLTGQQFQNEYLVDSNPFSSYARDYILDNYQPDFLNLAEAGDLEGLKALTSKNYAGKTYIEEINMMVSSRFAVKNLTNIYGEKEINISGLYTEICRCLNFVKPETDKTSYKYADYKIPDELVVEATNSTLNNLLGDYLDPSSDVGSMVAPIIDALLESKIVLYDADGGVLKDLWINLYKAPIETIVNLIPTLSIALDELLVPILLNEGQEGQTDLYEVIAGVGGILHDYTQEVGSKIGVGALHIDLNKAVPAILHYLVGDVEYAKNLVGTYDGSPWTSVEEKDGVKTTETGVYETYVPRFLNIYIADKALADAHLNGGLSTTLQKDKYKDDGTLDKKGMDKATADGVDELVTELATFAMGTIDEYLSVHGQDPRYRKDNEAVVSQRGLNNLFVALPQIIDGLGKKFVQKYGIKSDWTYTYEGKIVSVEKTFDDGTFEQLQNNTLEAFKATATTNDPNAVLNEFVNILIGNWINALLDILNDTIMDGNNKITSQIALIQGVLVALGGFGDTSIITDVFNGLFQLKRSDVASFTLTKRSTGFVGFSNESGFFLLTNLQFEKNNTQRGLIPVIMDLINGKKPEKPQQPAQPAQPEQPAQPQQETAKTAPLLVPSTTDYAKLLTEENIKAADSLVKVLDDLLASLLANTSLNGFDWDSTDNLLSSVVTFASAYLGAKNTNDIVKILDDYLYFIVGESKAAPSTDGNIGTAPTADGNVDAKQVYTSANLSNLVIQTYSLIENIVDYLFYAGDDYGLISVYKDPNKLIADAVYGLVSPDSVAVRMTGYAETAKILKDKDNLNWNSFKVQISNADTQAGTWKKDYLKYGFNDGDKTAFYNALGESLSGVAGILGALLASGTGYYQNVLYPVLNSIANATGATGVMTPEAFLAATAPQQLVNGLLAPLSGILGTLYKAPFSFILNLVKGLAGVLDDDSIRAIIGSALAPINGLVPGLANVVKYLSPSLAGVVTSKVNLNVKLDLPASNIIVTLVNQLLGDIDVKGVKLGKILTLPIIDWKKLAASKTPGETLLLIYAYAVDAILDSTLLSTLIDSMSPGLIEILKNLSAAQIFNILREVLAVVQSPTEVYWTFSQYAKKLSKSFTYPTGITAYDANKAVGQLDDIVANIFPLLNGLGVTDIEGLGSLVNDKLYTNEILTTIATALYGALNSNSTVVQVFGALGIDVTTTGVAAYLTDKSYGKTYSSAAATIKKAKNWKKIKNIDWGFKNGSAKAQTGFINGLVAILRPLNGVLSILLAEGSLDLSAIDLAGVISTLDLSGSTQLGEKDATKPDYQYGCNLDYILKEGILTLKFRSNAKNADDTQTQASVLKINLIEVINTLMGDLSKNGPLQLGTNGYESAIIPLLEAFMCKNVKTYSQYLNDYKKAKDNLLIDVLNPIFGLVDDVLAAPFDTVTKILPNVAYYIDSNGIPQLLSNLLAPITSQEGIVGALSKNGLDIDKLIKEIAGKSLGKIVTDAIGVKGVKLSLEIGHLEKCNIHEIVIPLVNSLLKKNKINISIPNIDFGKIASHGTLKTVKSAAKNAQGKYTTKRVIANQGELLIAVLRYVANVLIVNASKINKLLAGIDAIKKNDTIKNVLASVFATIGNADKDDIVRAIFYFLMEDATDSYFDYRDFTYKSYDFSFGEMDEDFCRTLAPMLDGLVSGLLEDKGGLLGLIGDLAYKDDVISSIACGLYGAIEGVKISDDIGSLTHLLAMTDIDFTTGNVASLLTDEAYGRTYESAAATIRNAGSWSKVNKDSLKWGVKDRDTFLNALVAVLRPIYGVLDVLLNDASLGIFNLVKIPGSDGYTSTIVPLLEAFGCYNIRTQYQYREDCFEAYDSVLLDIINPLWDKVEDILNAPIEMLADILPNLSLFFANNGLLQIIDNLLTPISALLNALKPIVNINDLLDALGVDLNALIAKAGLNLNIKLDIYDLKSTLEPLIGAENVVGLLNTILGIIKIGGASLGIELPEIDWYKLASHGEVILDATSQVATYGSRIYVQSDQDETLIAVLRFLIDTINYKGNYDAIVGLIGGLLGDGVSDSVSDVIGEVLGMLQGDSDEVIAQLVDLLQSIAG